MLPGVQALIAEGRAKGVTFTARSLRAYVAIELWAEAVRRAGSIDAARVSEVLHQGRFDTALGEVVFDAKGDIKGAPAEWSWHRLGVQDPRHLEAENTGKAN
jgi:branched-chain amino acid transport system substrate-binding protein